MDRAKVLLKAAHDILTKCGESDYVLDVMQVTAEYDGTDCGGYCLMDDIASYLDLED